MTSEELADRLDENAFLLSVKLVQNLPLRIRRAVAAQTCDQYGWDIDSFMDAVNYKGAGQ